LEYTDVPDDGSCGISCYTVDEMCQLGEWKELPSPIPKTLTNMDL